VKNKIEPMKAWAVFDGRRMRPDFFRTIADAQLYAGRRGMGAHTYKRLCDRDDGSGYGDFDGGLSFFARKAASRVWREFKRTHNGARLIRVTVSP
jgi:hypothetical protein